MNLLLLLMGFPLVMGAIMLVSPKGVRPLAVRLGAAVIGLASLYLLVIRPPEGAVYFAFHLPHLDTAIFAVEMAMSLFILAVGWRYRRPLVCLLAVVQAAIMAAAEHGGHGHAVANTLFLDNFSVIMGLIIGVIGALITVHAVGYMEFYHHHHPSAVDNRKGFFAVFFAFLGAMFGLVFTNSLTWLFFFWEITTLSSFALIAYPRTKEAINNAFLALTLNLLGGLGFAVAILLQVRSGGSLELSALTSGGAAALLPAILISFAGVTKAAQMPFSAWLLGAMVAPTPVSALLHSSTMVKAGVYVIIRFAPVLHGTTAGLILALVGAVTFLITSLAAISQSNAKRVLAYSTIANLGLIVACAGVGNAQAVWAAIMLVIFHAIAKALLFLTVGTVEHQIGSRDIENMHGLITRLPQLAVYLLVGAAGMFLAPFGMLISKWAAMEALILANPILAILVCFGSAATLFFWSKWMGSLLATGQYEKPDAHHVHGDEKLALGSLAALTVGICAMFPLVSTELIEPYLGGVSVMSSGNLITVAIMLTLIMFLPLSLLRRGGPDERVVAPYLGGANVQARLQFTGSLGVQTQNLSNYYLRSYVGEERMMRIGIASCTALLLAMVVTCL